MLYSLAGPAAVAPALEEAEERLRNALLQACLRDPACGGLLAPGAATARDHAPPPAPSAELLMSRRSALDASLQTLFSRLHRLALARRGGGGKSAAAAPLLLSAAQTAGEVYRPLARHAVGRALRHEEVPELHRLSNSIGSLFSRGANLLGVGSAKARLTDHPLLIVFFVGGVSLAELRELRQLVAQHPKHRLLVGGTGLTSPQSLCADLTRGLHIADRC